MKMSRAWKSWLMAMVVATACAGSPAAPPAEPGSLYARITDAQRQAVAFLRGQIGKDGSCEGQYDKHNPRFGGKTALCVYALLSAGVDYRQGDVQRAINWLLDAKLDGTYAVALRACALAAIKDARVPKALAADVDWLVKAAASNGAYTYTSYGGAAVDKYDNSNSQMAVLGVWAGARRGLPVPPEYWQRIEKFWQAEQQSGGWGYFARDRGKTKTYGSMSAAGLATLFICFDTLHREEFIRPTATSDPKPIADGLKWLGDNFSAQENPKLGDDRYYYWLYTVGRVGLASGYRYFGGHDWYALGAEELLSRQNIEGSWDYGPERLAQTSMAALFLASGREPLVFNKLHYEGKWNARPRDMANLTMYINDVFESRYRWQVVDMEAPTAQWHDAPILYISGAGAVDFSQEQVDKLRTFVQQGGAILSESAGNNGDFTLDVKKLYQRMFPALNLVRLEDTHPVYSAQFTCKDKPGLMGLYNGVRMLAIHCPRELSLDLQMGPSHASTPTFELAANIFFYLTDRGQLRAPGSEYWPSVKPFTPAATIRVARVKYDGDFDPEPLAWPRLAALMANRHRIALQVSEPTDPDKLDAKSWPVAAMTGTKSFTLTASQAAGLKKYLAQGGRLIVEAAGGSKEFADSAKSQLLPLWPQAKLAPVVWDHVIYRQPDKLDKIVYRGDFALTIGPDKDRARLQAVVDGGRIVMVFSAEDLTAGLLGVPSYRLKGYSPEAAVSLMTNILCYLNDIKP
jgi:hypothetical protein